eukprot:g78584.t1
MLLNFAQIFLKNAPKHRTLSLGFDLSCGSSPRLFCSLCVQPPFRLGTRKMIFLSVLQLLASVVLDGAYAIQTHPLQSFLAHEGAPTAQDDFSKLVQGHGEDIDASPSYSMQVLSPELLYRHVETALKSPELTADERVQIHQLLSEAHAKKDQTEFLEEEAITCTVKNKLARFAEALDVPCTNTGAHAGNLLQHSVWTLKTVEDMLDKAKDFLAIDPKANNDPPKLREFALEMVENSLTSLRPLLLGGFLHDIGKSGSFPIRPYRAIPAHPARGFRYLTGHPTVKCPNWWGGKKSEGCGEFNEVTEFKCAGQGEKCACPGFGNNVIAKDNRGKSKTVMAKNHNFEVTCNKQSFGGDQLHEPVTCFCEYRGSVFFRPSNNKPNPMNNWDFQDWLRELGLRNVEERILVSGMVGNHYLFGEILRKFPNLVLELDKEPPDDSVLQEDVKEIPDDGKDNPLAVLTLTDPPEPKAKLYDDYILYVANNYVRAGGNRLSAHLYTHVLAAMLAGAADVVGASQFDFQDRTEATLTEGLITTGDIVNCATKTRAEAGLSGGTPTEPFDMRRSECPGLPLWKCYQIEEKGGMVQREISVVASTWWNQRLTGMIDLILNMDRISPVACTDQKLVRDSTRTKRLLSSFASDIDLKAAIMKIDERILLMTIQEYQEFYDKRMAEGKPLLRGWSPCDASEASVQREHFEFHLSLQLINTAIQTLPLDTDDLYDAGADEEAITWKLLRGGLPFILDHENRCRFYFVNPEGTTGTFEKSTHYWNFIPRFEVQAFAIDLTEALKKDETTTFMRNWLEKLQNWNSKPMQAKLSIALAMELLATFLDLALEGGLVDFVTNPPDTVDDALKPQLSQLEALLLVHRHNTPRVEGTPIFFKFSKTYDMHKVDSLAKAIPNLALGFLDVMVAARKPGGTIEQALMLKLADRNFQSTLQNAYILLCSELYVMKSLPLSTFQRNMALNADNTVPYHADAGLLCKDYACSTEEWAALVTHIETGVKLLPKFEYGVFLQGQGEASNRQNDFLYRGSNAGWPPLSDDYGRIAAYFQAGQVLKEPTFMSASFELQVPAKYLSVGNTARCKIMYIYKAIEAYSVEAFGNNLAQKEVIFMPNVESVVDKTVAYEIPAGAGFVITLGQDGKPAEFTGYLRIVWLHQIRPGGSKAVDNTWVQPWTWMEIYSECEAQCSRKIDIYANLNQRQKYIQTNYCGLMEDQTKRGLCKMMKSELMSSTTKRGFEVDRWHNCTRKALCLCAADLRRCSEGVLMPRFMELEVVAQQVRMCRLHDFLKSWFGFKRHFNCPRRGSNARVAAGAGWKAGTWTSTVIRDLLTNKGGCVAKLKGQCNAVCDRVRTQLESQYKLP